jgi:hypothetical protein
LLSHAPLALPSFVPSHTSSQTHLLITTTLIKAHPSLDDRYTTINRLQPSLFVLFHFTLLLSRIQTKETKHNKQQNPNNNEIDLLQRQNTVTVGSHPPQDQLTALPHLHTSQPWPSHVTLQAAILSHPADTSGTQDDTGI